MLHRGAHDGKEEWILKRTVGIDPEEIRISSGENSGGVGEPGVVAVWENC